LTGGIVADSLIVFSDGYGGEGTPTVLLLHDNGRGGGATLTQATGI